MSQQFKVLYDFTAEEEGEMSVKTGEIVAAVQDVPGADDPPDGWIHVEVVGENERGFVPIDYLDPVQSAGSVKKVEEIKSNKPFGGKSIFPAAVNAPPPAPKQIKTVFPATNNAEPLTNPTSKLTGVMAAFKAGPNRSQSPPNRPQSPPNRAQSNANVPFSSTPPPASHYTPAVSQPTPLHSPITAALASSTAGNKSSMNVGTSQVGGGLSKLKSAAKSVQSMVHVSSAVSAPRVPSLAAAVDREDFDELVRRNDEYFARLLSSQADTFSSLTDMVDSLSKKLTESTQSSSELVSKLSELDDLIDEEKRKWKQQHENEKNADVLGRSKELSQAAFESTYDHRT